jgi:DNA (cytosine-5)-methyltransferase 1
MFELSLFSGAGGGLLATTHLLGWHCVGYVEFNDYCQRVIKARIKDGYLHNAPIFGDIRTFLDEGHAESYQGMVDVVTGGFPCQPFSCAGKRDGENDPQNMWPQTLRVIQTVRPRYTFLENVPGLLTSGYFGTILRGLAESGYDARWICLSASNNGLTHKRNRVWIVAHSKVLHGMWGKEEKGGQYIQKPGGFEFARDIKSRLHRAYDRLACDVDRLKSIGNGQVPIVAATAWKILTGE